MTMTVAELAERVGVSPDAVRYYERAHLIDPPPRSASGYRLYDEQVVDRLSFIKGAQHTGLKLRQIRELLEIIDRGACPCGHTERLLGERISEIDREMRQMRDVRKKLAAVKSELPSRAAEGGADPWPCERVFVHVGANPARANPKE